MLLGRLLPANGETGRLVEEPGAEDARTLDRYSARLASRAATAAMSPAQLADEMLATLRKEFFRGSHERVFFQQRDLLRQAITFPAKYLNDRGAASWGALPGDPVDGDRHHKRHGNRAKIERFSVYFLHCIQAHMQHHGDEYYEASKQPRTVGSLAAGLLQKARSSEPADNTVETLAEVHRILSSGRRIRKPKKTALQTDLFGPCKPPAKARIQG